MIKINRIFKSIFHLFTPLINLFTPVTCTMFSIYWCFFDIIFDDRQIMLHWKRESILKAFIRENQYQPPSFHWAERIEKNMAVLHVFVSCGYFFSFYFTLTPLDLHVWRKFANCAWRFENQISFRWKDLMSKFKFTPSIVQNLAKLR